MNDCFRRCRDSKTRHNGMWFQVTVLHVIKGSTTFFSFADLSHLLLVNKSLGLAKTQKLLVTFQEIMISGLQCWQMWKLYRRVQACTISRYFKTRGFTTHNSFFGPRMPMAPRYTWRKIQYREITTCMCTSYSMELALASPFSWCILVSNPGSFDV